jgi:glycosyltransferase involved in cell wall biosynthesis
MTAGDRSQPAITVIIPARDRPIELLRALRSLQAQVEPAFEAVVIDDGSIVPLAPTVESLKDDRLRYLRLDRNLGPSGARYRGYQLARGKYVTHLDSDCETFPWTLKQMCTYLNQYPHVDGVIGLYSRTDGRDLVRMLAKSRFVSPEDTQREPLVGDRVGAVRRAVVQEWLCKRADYFALEFHQWLTFASHHSQLYVNERWARCYVSDTGGVSSGFTAEQAADWPKFLREHAWYIEHWPSRALDEALGQAYVTLRRRGYDDEAALVLRALKDRGRGRLFAFRRALTAQIRWLRRTPVTI